MTAEKKVRKNRWPDEILIEPSTGTPYIGFAVITPELKLGWLNEALSSRVGIEPDNAVGKNCFEVLRGEKEECADCPCRKTFETGKIVCCSFKKSDTAGNCQLVAIPLKNSSGKIENVLSVSIDLSDSSSTKEYRSEDYYKTLFEHSGTAVAVVDEDMTLIDVNRRFEKMTGYSREEIVGKMKSRDLNTDPEQDAIYHIKRREDPRSAPTNYESAILCKDGSIRTVEISVEIIPGTRKSIVSMIDITDLREIQKAKHRQEQELLNILKTSVDGIISFDLDKNIKSWNRGAENIFKYSSQEAVNMKFDKLLPEEWKDSGKMDALIKQVLSRGFVQNISCTNIRKDGTPVEAEMTLTGIRDEEGKISTISAVIRDISEQKRMERNLIQLEKMSLLGQLSASLTHEIKNPLNSIFINIEVLKNSIESLPPQDKENIARQVNIVSEEIHRLHKVLQGFLDFARPAGDMLGKVNLNQIVEKVITLVAIQAKRQDVYIEFNPNPSLPEIIGEENQLHQIFLNLILNSIEALPNGGRIEVCTYTDRYKRVCCSVSDNGVGISPSDIDKIFDLYFSTKRKGSGIGLALVKRMVEYHGGRINVKSKPGKGNTFEVIFPKLKESALWKREEISS